LLAPLLLLTSVTFLLPLLLPTRLLPMFYSSCEFLLLLLASLRNIFSGLEWVGHAFAYVAHLVFLRHFWIRIQTAAEANRRTVNLVTHLPILATHLPCLATHLPAESCWLLVASLLLLLFFLRFGGMMPLFLFIFHICITYIHSITFIQYIYPSPFAGVSLHIFIA
jgi:hypothetical protein